MQDSKEREYIGKIEPDGPVVLRVVLSDSIPSDHQQLTQAVRARVESLQAELHQQDRNRFSSRQTPQVTAGLQIDLWTHRLKVRGETNDLQRETDPYQQNCEQSSSDVTPILLEIWQRLSPERRAAWIAEGCRLVHE